MAITDTWAFALGATGFTVKFDYDISGNQVYVGWSQPGSATSDNAWRIMQQTFNASNQATDIKWPNASTAFNFTWDNRSTYSYS